MILRYNINTKNDFYRPEIEALRQLLEVPHKTFTLVKGYIMKLIQDLGMKTSQNGKYKYRYGMFECESCGYIVERITSSAKRAIGCVKCKSESHGMSNTQAYNSYNAMINRTTRPSNKNYESYKDKVPPKKWFTFEGFWEDMGDSYFDGATIDRIDNSRGYSKENCRWATHSTQSQNTSRKIGKSGYRGVKINRSKFEANVNIEGKRHYLGVFNTAKAAAIVRDEFIIKNNTEHPLNFDRSNYGNNTDR